MSTLSQDGWLRRYGLRAWRLMSAIREFELLLQENAKGGRIVGSTHLYVGMEAIAVGVSLNLRRTDYVASTHRGHGHCLAKGSEPGRLFAEIFGRSDGYCGGKGGSMHIGVADIGILGTNGIVGASIGLGTGAALAAKMTASDTVSVAYFGDGALNQGLLYEAMNLAAIWRLPCLYVCENNHFAQSSRVEEMVSGGDLAERAKAYGIPGTNVDGTDVHAVFEATRTAVRRARNGLGPSFIVADAYRVMGHSSGDTEIYRSPEEVATWKLKDPIKRLEHELLRASVVDRAQLEALHAQVKRRMKKAETFAANSPEPPPAAALTDVYGVDR